MLNDYKPTHDPNQDTFRTEYLLGAAAVLAIIFPYKYTPTEMLWAFSIWLESVAILPQLFMLQRTGSAETITTHYIFALGAYRALYIPNWIWRCVFNLVGENGLAFQRDQSHKQQCTDFQPAGMQWKVTSTPSP
jgi:ER lumen protein retaining receptor